MMIKAAHLKCGDLNFCNRGGRRFCKMHGLSWSQFRTTGIPAEDLIATGDARAIEFVRRVEAWAAKAAVKQ